jgi:uncharacterized membrane-anchored protein YhcB (DUF1043 family)
MLSISVVELLVMILVLPLLGGVIGYVVGNDRARGEDNSEAVAALEVEFADYKRGVSGHFQETAELMHHMTEQYRTLYSHMAKSAVNLCDTREDLPQLQEFTRPGLVFEEGEADTGQTPEPRGGNA